MTIFVIWQLIVTLDSIRNSCDVLLTELNLSVSLAGLAAFLIFLPESNWSVSLAAFLNFYFLFGRIELISQHFYFLFARIKFIVYQSVWQAWKNLDFLLLICQNWVYQSVCQNLDFLIFDFWFARIEFISQFGRLGSVLGQLMRFIGTLPALWKKGTETEIQINFLHLIFYFLFARIELCPLCERKELKQRESN